VSTHACADCDAALYIPFGDLRRVTCPGCEQVVCDACATAHGCLDALLDAEAAAEAEASS
jgi:hypothetical protein